MINVIKRNPAPRANITCANCGSELEYGNADLAEEYYNNTYALYAAGKNYYFYCPVCGCKVIASWIFKKQE